MQSTLTRKDFLRVAGAGAAGVALLGKSALSGCAPQHGTKSGPNVILIVLDTFRKDHVGAYGNDWIKTPNLDALSKQSLRFTRAYPESLPTILARRAIHTGIRTWPFRDWHRYKGVNVGLWGWQPIPEGQRHLAEILKENGYATLFVTDNLQQYDASMNFQRGFDAFNFIRGQTTDPYRPLWTCPQEKVRQALVRGAPRSWKRAVLLPVFRQHGLPQDGGGLVLTQGLHRGCGVHGGREGGGTVLPYG